MTWYDVLNWLRGEKMKSMNYKILLEKSCFTAFFSFKDRIVIYLGMRSLNQKMSVSPTINYL